MMTKNGHKKNIKWTKMDKNGHKMEQENQI